MRWWVALLWGALALPAAIAVANDGTDPKGPDLDGAALYRERTCFACHGVDAKTPILPVYPRLAGQSADYALQQMKDIKSGARANGNTAAMRGVMHLVNDAELEALAAYLESLAP
jgi:cytochrome c